MSLEDATQILAIRHGETDWNRDTRIQGQLDIPLNERGRAQARRLAAALAGEPLAAVYASDLARAWETAAALQGLGAPIHADARLRERSFGRFEGQTWDEIARRWPEQSLRWRRRDPDFAAEGGESLSRFYARCTGAVRELAQAHPGQTIAIVAHGGVMDCLYRLAARLELHAARSWTLGNASINRLIYSPEGFGLVGWNDDQHLQDLGLDDLAQA